MSHFIDWEVNAFGLDASCRVSQLTAPTFDAFLRDLFVPLCCGGMLCLPPTRKMAPDQMLNWLEEASVTLVHCVPSVLRALLAYQNLEPGFLNNKLPALQRICMSGEVLLPATVQAWHDLFGERIELVNFYGASETTMIRCHHRITAADVAQGYIPVGKPIADTHIIVLDHSGKPCPTGTPGEIHVSSPYFSLGYYKDDAATAQVFVPNPLAKNSQSKVYRSGDMGVMSVDGTLRFLGRRDGLVKINGVRVEIGEIENALLGHPEVAEAAVIAQSAEDGATSLHAYVVGAVGIAEILRPYLTTKLSSALVPHNIVQLDALPMTGSGKVDRKALGAQVLIAAPTTQSYVAPQTPVQETLAQLYADVLGREKVSIHDDFFALGGHSLKALMVLSRIRKTFKLELALRMLFETPTVAGLAARIDTMQGKAQPEVSQNVDQTSGQQEPVQPVIPHVTWQAAYEVSSAQRRLWLLHKLDPDSSAYHVPVLVALQDGVDRARMERALSLVVSRHESLRTVFVEDEASLLLQRIEPAAPVVLTERNIASEEELRVFARQYTTTPFDLTSGPLYRGEVLNTWDGRRLLAWCMHEIIADGMSAVILEREVMTLLADENSAALPALPVQYKDFAAWQNRLLGADSNHASRNHWHQQFATEVPRLQLPFDHALTVTTTTQAQKYRQIVSGPAFERIKTLCRERQVTLFMLLQASLSAWLTRLTGEQDVVFAIPVAGREQADVEALIGFFLNTVLLRTQVDPAESFNALLARSKDIALEALQHQQYPFEQLIEDLSLPRPANQFPVTPVLFNVLNFLDEQLPLEHEGARHETVDRDVKVELEFTVQEHSNALSFQCQYRSALFKPETIEYLMEQWLSLLQQVSANSATAVGELAIFDSEQARKLASPYLKFALLAANLTEPESVLARLRRITKAQPDSVALAWRDERWTYAELDKQSERVAGHLQKLVCQAGDIVALLLESPLSHVAAVLGTMKAGAVFVTLDPADPEAKLRAQIERVAPRWWVAEERTRSAFAASAGDNEAPRLGIWLGSGKAEGNLKALAAQAKASEVKLPAHAPCYIFFTSGSTGTPKPILGSITSLSHFIDWEINAFGLDASCRVSQLTAPTFDAFLRDLFVPLCCGGMLCLPPTRKMAPDQMLNWLEEASVTLVHCVPSVLRSLLAYQNLEPGFLNNKLPALQRICMSGEVLLPATVQAWHDLFGERIELVNFYGASETTMIRCHHRITAADVAQGYIPVGKPIADTHIIVLDHSGKPCPTGTPGEIHVSSPYFSLGYYKDDAATAQVFVPNPLAKNSQSKVYRSGDMGVMSVEGTLRFLGRRDGLVKINGVRVEIGEIENALLGHPEVAEAAVIAQSAEDGATSLHAYVVGAVGIAEILRPYLTTKLSSALVPHNIVQLDALPMTGSGKVDRKALGAQVMIAAPTTQSYVAPQTPVQETLAQLYADVLGREKVSIHDDFFALGGHSLKALMVLSRIRKTFKLELALRMLFETPTVAGLADRIETMQKEREANTDIDNLLAQTLDELTSLTD